MLLGVFVGVTDTVGVIPVVYVVPLPPHPTQSDNEVGVFVGVLDIVGVVVGVLESVGVFVGVLESVGVFVGVFEVVGVLVGVTDGV